MTTRTPRFRKFRAGVIATSFAAVVFTGVIYGAGLKTQKEWKDKREEFRASPFEEQIAILEAQRAHLTAQRETMKDKLKQFELRAQERKAEAERKRAEQESKAP